MGKGANITFVNETDLKILFGTSDREMCWKDDTLDNVNGSIEPNGRSARFGIEGSSNTFNGCKFKTASVKFKFEEKGNSDKHFANVEILQNGTRYLEVGKHVNNLNADSVIEHRGGGQDEITVYLTKPYNRSRWITDLADPSRSISEINLPGTHDSGTFADLVADFDGLRGNAPIDKNTFAKCQDNNISQQLNQGIRFFDIRLASLDKISAGVSWTNAMGAVLNWITEKKSDGNLYIVHDKILYDHNFGQVLRDCKQFLTDNPKEFIVMSVKSDGYGFDENIWETKYDSDAIFYNGCEFPTAGQAAGKIVLLRRFGDDKYNGFEFSVGDDRSGVESKKRLNCSAEYKYAYQDKYYINLEKQDEKQTAVSDFIDTYFADKTGLLLANFISYVGNYSNWISTAWIKLPYPREAAWRMMPWLHDKLVEKGKGKYGILIMDFPAQVVIDKIIKSNC